MVKDPDDPNLLNPPKIYLDCMIFKAYIELLLRKCRIPNLNVFKLSNVIAELFRLGDIETVLLILLIERHNWDEVSGKALNIYPISILP